MGLFDRFKKDKNEKKERPPKEIPKDVEIPEVELQLKEIAMNSKNRNERAVAVNNITNQYVALDLAKNVKDRAIRLIAANKLEDEDLLWDAALNSNFYDVRSFAYERLGENNKSIAEMVINQKKSKEITEIFNKVEDEETLKDIAINAIDKKYRKEALEKINDEEILADLVFKANDKVIRKNAVLKDSFTNEDTLQKIAMTDSDGEVRIAAIS